MAGGWWLVTVVVVVVAVLVVVVVVVAVVAAVVIVTHVTGWKIKYIILYLDVVKSLCQVCLKLIIIRLQFEMLVQVLLTPLCGGSRPHSKSSLAVVRSNSQ